MACRQTGRCTCVEAVEAWLGAWEEVGVVAALAQLHDQHLQLLPGVVLLVVLHRVQRKV